MNKIVLRLTLAVCVLAGLFRLAGRSPLELKGLLRASADVAVDDITNELPPDRRRIEKGIARTAEQDPIDEGIAEKAFGGKPVLQS